MMYKRQAGLTLMELTVVLLILFALAGVTIPYVAGTGSKAMCDATDVTMANIKRAIMDRYYLDTLGTYPVSKGGSDYSLKYLFIAGGWADYDPDTGVGWRGPYLTNAATLESEAELSTNLTSAAGTYVHVEFADDDVVINDSWGRPIVLQVPASADCDTLTGLSGTVAGYCARLVSAGPGNGSGIENGDIETKISGHRPATSDDRILYLNAPTPSEDVNHSCD